MLKKLKRSFVLLSTGLTGLVLLAACLFAYNLQRVQAETAYREAFEYQSQALAVLLAGAGQLDHQQVYRLQKESGIQAFLFDNGNPIHVAGGDAELRNTVYGPALENLSQAAGGEGLNPTVRYNGWVNQNADFMLDGEEYFAKFISSPTGPRQWYSMVLVKPVPGKKAEAARLRALYAGVFLAGLALLCGIGWWLAKRAVRPLEKAQQRQKEFIAAASHELKSPLAVILSSADMAAARPGEVPAALANIRGEAGRMAGLVDDLLLLAGAESGRWTVRRAAANPEDMLAAAYERFMPVARSKNQKLALCLPAYDLPVIQADEERVMQVLAILLSNASAYSPPGSGIELGAALHRDEVVLTVADHGPGIPPEEKERIFEGFYRAQGSRADKAHFGLGLAVAQELAGLHGGSVHVKDTPGGGATFLLHLPGGA